MDAPQTLTNALVVTAVGAVLAWLVTGSRRERRSEMGDLRTELRAEIRALRSDLTQVALAVGVRPRAQND